MAEVEAEMADEEAEEEEEEEEERVEFREEEVIESLQYRRLCSVKRLFNGRKEYRLTLW